VICMCCCSSRTIFCFSFSFYFVSSSVGQGMFAREGTVFWQRNNSPIFFLFLGFLSFFLSFFWVFSFPIGYSSKWVLCITPQENSFLSFFPFSTLVLCSNVCVCVISYMFIIDGMEWNVGECSQSTLTLI